MKEKASVFRGHVCLVNSTLSAIPLFLLSFFKVLKMVLTRSYLCKGGFCGEDLRMRTTWHGLNRRPYVNQRSLVD